MQRVLLALRDLPAGRERRRRVHCRRTCNASWGSGMTASNGRHVDYGVNEVTDDFKDVLELHTRRRAAGSDARTMARAGSRW